MKYAVLASIFGLWLLAGSTFAFEAKPIVYVSHTGDRFIVFDPVAQHVSYQGTANIKERGDQGGQYTDCSTKRFLCASITGHAIAVPSMGDLPPNWDLGPAHFHVLQILTGGDHKVWLISVTEKGDTYLHFSYSRERGVETLSNQMNEEPKYLAVTHFLVGRNGLLGVSRTGSPGR